MVWLGFWLVLCFDGVDQQLVLLVDFGVNRQFLAALGLMWWCDGGIVVGSVVLGSSDVGLS